MDGEKHRVHLKGLPIKELGEQMVKIKEQKFRGQQIFDWMYNHLVDDPEYMTNLPKPLRRKLSRMCEFNALQLVHKERSKTTGTIKYTFKTIDDKKIETVLIKMDENRATLCLSTQIGCPLACEFCATGKMGFDRNLTAGEIIDQYILAAKDTSKDYITNIVYMGMGEPLTNYDETMKSLKIITSEFNKTISRTRITLSTAGIPNKIRELADSGLRIKLALSLHSCDDETRTKLMPINEKYPLSHVVNALKYYCKTTNTRVTLEYTLLKGINDSMNDIDELVKLSRRMPCKINLIPFNSIKHMYPKGLAATLEPVTMAEMDLFAHYLREKHITVMIRQSAGDDLNAACGQLASLMKDIDNDDEEIIPRRDIEEKNFNK